MRNRRPDVISPCIRVCKVHKDRCIGCGRTIEQIRLWSSYSHQQRQGIMKLLKPEVYTKVSEKESKPKAEEPMAKPRGIERKGNKYKVFLEYEGKRIHIGYTKTFEQAEEMLKEAKREAGIDG